LEAALEELGETGYGAFAIESVAARAGVAKSTIYRHWRNKLDLISAAFLTLHPEAAPDVTTGSVTDRVDRVLRHVAEIVAEGVFARCIPALVDAAERSPPLRAFHHRFQSEARRPLVALIAEGVRLGDFDRAVDPELAASALLGVIFYRRLLSGDPIDPESAGALATSLLMKQSS
jgi:AcrR family transcriptional regulator